MDGTDPLDPCENLLDTDGDGLNNYFENTTGCVVIFPGMGGNLTNDILHYEQSDTDNGGVTDFQEYLDGTSYRIILMTIEIQWTLMEMEYPTLSKTQRELMEDPDTTEEEFPMDRSAPQSFGTDNVKVQRGTHGTHPMTFRKLDVPLATVIFYFGPDKHNLLEMAHL